MPREADIERARRLLALHDPRDPLLLPNAWDAASARLFADLGFAALATTSGGVAWSLGYADGERAPVDEILAATARIARATSLPVTADLEAGYGESLDALDRTVRGALDAGVVGINLEDGVDHARLRETDAAARRIACARAAADDVGIPLVLNARVDAWIVPDLGGDAARRDETLRRARAYLEAGADCIYPIGLADPAEIRALTSALGAPINVGARKGLPSLRALGELGVARVSTATRLAMVAYSAAREAARGLREERGFDALQAPLGYDELQRLFDRT